MTIKDVMTSMLDIFEYMMDNSKNKEDPDNCMDFNVKVDEENDLYLCMHYKFEIKTKDQINWDGDENEG